MAKHYLHGGCGVRPFIDTRILKEHAMASSALLEKGGLKRFDSAVQSLTDVWFDNAKPTTVTDEMEKFIQSGGTYGNGTITFPFTKLFRGINLSIFFSVSGSRMSS